MRQRGGVDEMACMRCYRTAMKKTGTIFREEEMKQKVAVVKTLG